MLMKVLRSKIQLVWFGIVAATLVAALGCSTKPDDHQIAQAVQTQIRNDSAIGGDVSVDSAGGVVTLSGKVGSEAARQLAGRDASGVAGVRVVTNNLSVTPPAEQAVAPPPVVEEKPVAKVQSKPVTRHSTPVKRPAEYANTAPPVQAAPMAPPPPQPAPVVAVAPPPPPPPPPAPTKYTIPAGSVLSVRLVDSLDSQKNRIGDTFRATLDSPIRADGEVVIPAGLDVEGRVVQASSAGKYTGHPELTLELSKLTAHGEVFPLRTDQYNQSAGGRGKGTAETVGTGAGLGAIIGGIAGGGKGAAIGAIAGAGAGGVARTAEKAPKISFPSETVLSFRLEEPLTVPASVATAQGGQRFPNSNSDRDYDSSRPQLKRRGGNFD